MDIEVKRMSPTALTAEQECFYGKKETVKRKRLLSHALTVFLVCGDYSSGRAKTSSLTS